MGSIASPSVPVVGDVLDGKYRLGRVLGQGGMGRVFVATHLLLGDEVAIKCLLSPSPSPELSRRFLREAQIVRAIRSPFAVKVFDAGAVDGGLLYLVMECLSGDDLRARLDACGPLPLAEAAELIIQACDALAEAHAAGVIHRDLKPSNLFLEVTAGGLTRLRVLDFGVAKVRRGLFADQSTQSTSPVGTPLYMSPEQITGKSIDARSDLWALGVLLFQMLTDELPFEADSSEALAVEISTRPPRPLASLRPDLPTAVVSLIESCLRVERAERPASVADVARALAPFAPPRAASLVEQLEQLVASTEPRAARERHATEPSVQDGATVQTLSGAEHPPATPSQSAHRGQPHPWRWAGLLLLVLAPALWAMARAPGQETSPLPAGADSAWNQPSAVEPPVPEASSPLPMLPSATPATTSASSTAPSSPLPRSPPPDPPRPPKPASARPSVEPPVETWRAAIRDRK